MDPAAAKMARTANPGVYRHYKGGRYRLLFLAHVSTNGPDDGRIVVVYVSLTTGLIHVRDEVQFHEELPELGVKRFTFEGP